MDFSRERLAGNWLFRRRPSRWHVLWLLPLTPALVATGWVFAQDVAEVREDVRAWENRDRGCVTDPCPTAHRVVDFRVTSGRRGSDDEYVTYQVEPLSSETREVEIDLGVVPRRRMDWDGTVLVVLRDDQVLGLVDASGRGWSDFDARPQAVGFHGQVAAWFVGAGVLCLAWLPLQWRRHGADFLTPGLPQLRLATTSFLLTSCLLMVLAVARAPGWLSWPCVLLLWMWIGRYAVRAWWQLWRHDAGAHTSEHPTERPDVGEAFAP